MFFCLGTFCRIWPLTHVLCVHCVLRIRLGWFLVGQSVFILCVVVFRLQPSCQHTFEACTCNTRTALYLQCLWTEASLTSSDQVGVRFAHHWRRRLDAYISRASFKMECCADMMRVSTALQEARTRSANQLPSPASVLIFVFGLAAQRFVSGVCGVGRERCRFSSVCLTSTLRSVQNAAFLICFVCESTCWNSGGESRRPLRYGHGRIARPHRNSHSDHGFGQFRGSWSDYCEDQGTPRTWLQHSMLRTSWLLVKKHKSTERCGRDCCIGADSLADYINAATPSMVDSLKTELIQDEFIASHTRVAAFPLELYANISVFLSTREKGDAPLVDVASRVHSDVACLHLFCHTLGGGCSDVGALSHIIVGNWREADSTAEFSEEVMAVSTPRVPVDVLRRGQETDTTHLRF